MSAQISKYDSEGPRPVPISVKRSAACARKPYGREVLVCFISYQALGPSSREAGLGPCREEDDLFSGAVKGRGLPPQKVLASTSARAKGKRGRFLPGRQETLHSV